MNQYKIKAINSKERKNIIKRLENIIEAPNELLSKKGNYARYIYSNSEAAIVKNNSEVILIEKKGYIFPSIKIAKQFNLKLPDIIVDVGAIKFIANGADIMRPGITKINDDVREAGLVIVREEKHGTILCIGSSLYDAVDMRALDSGKCVRNLHYVNDQWWNFHKQ